MKAGRMRHRLTLYRPLVDVVDNFVGVQKGAEQFEQIGEVDASIDTVSGREYFANDRELAGITWRITIRETPDFHIEPNWRGIDVDSGAVYDFHDILPSHDRAVLVLMASSGTAQP